MNASYDDLVGGDAATTERLAGDSLSAASGVTAGSAFAPKPRGAITAGVGRPNKSPASGKAPASGAKMTAGRQKLMAKLEKSRQAGAKARNTPKEGSKGRSGTLSERLEATRARPRTEKEANKFGPLVKRDANLPAKQGARAVTPYKEGARGVTKYSPRGGAVATTGPRTFGDKSGKGSGMGTWMKRGAAAGAVGGAGYGLYQGADKPKAEVKSAGGARPGERAGAYPAAKRTESKAPVPKAKPARGSSTGTSKPVKAAGDKSRAAKPEKKFSNFERMKQRQYEKEGYGGRSMTTERAKAQVMKERGQKLEIPRFGKAKTANKQAPKMSEIKYKSQKARDFAAKMQGQRPSGKAEKKFRFKDLFK